jgi:HPt (histidine-containing phosphotransfer) domain-containing protein
MVQSPFQSLLEARERLLSNEEELAHAIEKTGGLEAEVADLNQKFTARFNSFDGMQQRSASEVELDELIRAAKKILRNRKAAAETLIETAQDPELRRLRARLAYCEEMLAHGDQSQKPLVLQFMAEARARFATLRRAVLAEPRSVLRGLRERQRKLELTRETAQHDFETGRSLVRAKQAALSIASAERDALMSSAQSLRTEIAHLEARIAAVQGEIRELTRQRGIQCLIHFTPIRNIPSILKHGILPRTKLQAMQLPAVLPDHFRFDGLLDRISLSISWPNYRMLYSKTAAYSGEEYCLCLIAPEALWERHCYFCPTNAATQGLRDRAVRDGWTSKALEGLFFEISKSANGRDCRSARLLPDSYPTNPQAEVLLEGDVPREWIIQLNVRSTLSRERLIAEYAWPPDIFDIADFVNFDSDGFDKRIDWAHWTRD